LPVCPSYTLINSEGRHCRLPNKPDICDRCLAKNQLELVRRPDGGIARWRAIWGPLIADADTVLCFSENTARLAQKAYPHAAAKSVIRLHRVDYLPRRLPRVDLNANLHIGIVGGINFAKGAEVVLRIGVSITARNLEIRITVVGRMWYDTELPQSYERENLAEIVEEEGINLCFLPSIWPETFSFVTEELMQLKMPLCCFDLGAPADRLRAYPLGQVLSSIDDPNTALDEIIAFYDDLHGREPQRACVK
jgi:hypothetical protein